MSSKQWPVLGTVVQNPKKDKDGNLIRNANGKVELYPPQFKLDDRVTILFDGEPVALNKYRSGMMVTPVQEVENLYQNGAISEDKIEQRREKAQSLNWLRYTVKMTPPRD